MSESAVQPESLSDALLVVQERAPKVVKDATADVPTKTGGKYKYGYTTLGKLNETLRPLLSELKLLWTAWPSISPDGKPALDYELEHVPSKEKRAGQMLLMLPGSAGPQDQGGGISYARRYALIAALNLSPDKDEDGQMQGDGAQPARGAQARKITKVKAGELWDAANRASVTDRLQLAASHVLGADAGDCSTKADAEKALCKLNAAQAAKLADWIAKKAAEALDA
jgi:hypothetical protein